MGVEYQSDEAVEALEQCEIAFKEKFCGYSPSRQEDIGRTCLTVFFSDGFDKKGISYVERHYTLGDRQDFEDDDKDTLDVGIVTDGRKCWWWNPDWQMIDDIPIPESERRIFYEKPEKTVGEWFGEF